MKKFLNNPSANRDDALLHIYAKTRRFLICFFAFICNI